MNFEDRYFKDSPISNYKDYTQKKYDDLCEDLIALGVGRGHEIVDFGCATGSLLHEFSVRGYEYLFGTDVSWWAIAEGRRRYGFSKDVLHHLNYSLLEMGAGWVFALDVLEHVGMAELEHIIGIMNCGRLVVRVPVSAKEGEAYVLPVSRNDKTHIQCHTKPWWIKTLSPKFVYEGSIMGKAIYDSPGVFAAVFRCAR